MKIVTEKLHTADVKRGFFNEVFNRNVKSAVFDMNGAEIEYTDWEKKREKPIRAALGKKLFESKKYGKNTINLEMNAKAFIDGLYDPQNIVEGGKATIHVYVGEFKDENTKEVTYWFRVNKIEPNDDVEQWEQYAPKGVSGGTRFSGSESEKAPEISDDDLPF